MEVLILPRNVLIAVTGLSPQVVTETLYAFINKQPDLFPEEIKIITTIQGKQRILTDLLHPQTGYFHSFCREYEIPPQSISFDSSSITVIQDALGNPLQDIVTADDNSATVDQINQFIRRLCTEKDNRILASIAGGRKTMSVILAYAMILWGRPGDKLFHVLVNRKFESHPEFFYPPKKPIILKTAEGKEISTAQAKIELAEIPFIKLGDYIGASLQKYISSESYEKTTRDLNKIFSTQPLICDFQRRILSIGEDIINLTPVQMTIYYILLTRKKASNEGRPSFISLPEMHDIRTELADIYYKLPTRQSEQHPFLIDDYKDFQESMRSNISKINRVLKKNLSLNPDPYLIKNIGKYGDSRYCINLPPNKIEIR